MVLFRRITDPRSLQREERGYACWNDKSSFGDIRKLEEREDLCNPKCSRDLTYIRSTQRRLVRKQRSLAVSDKTSLFFCFSVLCSRLCPTLGLAQPYVTSAASSSSLTSPLLSSAPARANFNSLVFLLTFTLIVIFSPTFPFKTSSAIGSSR